jgi:hypothetical protein
VLKPLGIGRLLGTELTRSVLGAVDDGLPIVGEVGLAGISGASAGDA